MDYTVIPAAIYTSPEIGVIGLTEDQAYDMGMDVKVGMVELRSLGISHATGNIVGVAKIISNAVSDQIVGIHIIAERAADIIHEVAVSMFSGMTSSSLGRVIHAHPTVSELVLEAARAISGTALYMVKRAA